MKKLLIIIVVVAAGYFAYTKISDSPALLAMDSPVYGEMRVDARLVGRQFQVVLYGKMSSMDDCERRGKRGLSNMLKSCSFCEFKSMACLPTANSRIESLFDDTPTHLTYASMTRGSSAERDGRAIVWGASKKESIIICESMLKEIKKNYKGKVACINP